jgi:hypothetical protein
MGIKGQLLQKHREVVESIAKTAEIDDIAKRELLEEMGKQLEEQWRQSFSAEPSEQVSVEPSEPVSVSTLSEPVDGAHAASDMDTDESGPDEPSDTQEI